MIRGETLGAYEVPGTSFDVVIGAVVENVAAPQQQQQQQCRVIGTML